MTDKELWDLFKSKNNVKADKYEAWAFGAAPDKLLDLVLKGIKVGTASAYDLYEKGIDPLPKEGDYSVILDSKGEAKCIIKTTKLYVKPFNEVDESHAYKEGEGDKSLSYWREVHQEFFTDCLKEVDMDFTEDMKVLCEEFELVYSL